MVEGVVQLGAELQGPAFALQRKPLHESDIPVILSRSADGVYGSVAGIDGGPVRQVGHDKRSRIKPAIEGSIPVRKLGPCDDVRPYSVTPAGEIDALHGAKANRLRQSTGHRGYTRNLPVVEYAADQQFRPGTSHKFTGLWKVPNVVHDEHMGLVEVGGAIRPYPPRQVCRQGIALAIASIQGMRPRISDTPRYSASKAAIDGHLQGVVVGDSVFPRIPV